MYQFRISAFTQTGESVGLVGSIPELGMWDISKCVRLRTSRDRYPLWWADVNIDLQSSFESGDRQNIQYKYVRLDPQGNVHWEALGADRWVPIDPEHRSGTIVVDDGAFGYLQPYPFGYLEKPDPGMPQADESQGLKVAVIGSSVALGQKAWLLRGWSWLLGQALLEKYGHQLVNVSAAGANVSRTIERFAASVTAEQPDVVVIALSLGNEGLAHCSPHARRSVQRRFESGLQQLLQMTQDIGARPILGGVYPHSDYQPEHQAILRETHHQMLTWGVPVLDWLAAVDNGAGRWQDGISFDPAHPNTIGHRLMYEAIDLHLFDLDRDKLALERQHCLQPQADPILFDNAGFRLWGSIAEPSLGIENRSPYTYSITPAWQQLQTAIQTAGIIPGVYIAKYARPENFSFAIVQANGTIGTSLEIPPGTKLEYRLAFNLSSPNDTQLLFDGGQLKIFQGEAGQLWVINESDCEYNIHPMWREVRLALKALPAGLYADPLHPDLPFRTMMIGSNGLESRVKAPAKSAIQFQYKCQLADVSRVGILPLGDRCAIRMMLYKMQYDGPAFPFDLTRTNSISDIADIIDTGFDDMWNPVYLHYNPEANRIYHRKWTGLSFGHEVDDTDNPLHDLSPIHERMRVRYTARSQRFGYTIDNCDKILFVRTGCADRDGVIDLIEKLEKRCQGKPFLLLILSLQSADEFLGMPQVRHYHLDFNPDRMYDDLEHWMHCTQVMQGILEDLDVSTKNLFWCPPHPATEGK